MTMISPAAVYDWSTCTLFWQPFSSKL